MVAKTRVVSKKDPISENSESNKTTSSKRKASAPKRKQKPHAPVYHHKNEKKEEEKIDTTQHSFEMDFAIPEDVDVVDGFFFYSDTLERGRNKYCKLDEAKERAS